MNEVEICNMALSLLGAKARVTSIDPPDGSSEARLCAQFYRVERDALLEQPWAFNLRRTAGVLEEEQTEQQWDYLYVMPDDALTVLSVLPLGARDDDDTVPFKVELFGDSKVIATDLPDATIRYTVSVTDTNLFSPTFIQALSWALASTLAGPIIRGETGAAEAKKCLGMAEVKRAKAAEVNARNRRGRPEHIPKSISARGGHHRA